MGFSNQNTRLAAGSLLALVLGSYLFSNQAQAASAGKDINQVNGRIEIEADQQVRNISSVNGSIHLACSARAGQVQTVNGSIQLADHVVIRQARTVNGKISVEPQSVVGGSLTTTNGSIDLREGVTVKGELKTVNGAIQSGPGSILSELVKTGNGNIRLRNTRVGRNVETSSGDILLTEGTVVRGDVVIHRRSSLEKLFSLGRNTQPLISIDGSSRVKGAIHLYREVNLDIHPDAQVGRIVHHY